MKAEIAEEIADEKFEASKRLAHGIEEKPSTKITVKGETISTDIETSSSYSIKPK